MALIADMLLLAGTLGATLYCYVLARRLRRFNDLEKGMGGAIAVLSAQVDDMTKALNGAQNSARHSTDSLEGLTGRAEQVAHRLEILVAAMHDLPDHEAAAAPGAAPAPQPAPEPAQAAFEPAASEPALLFRRSMREAAE
jgi:hypothetical protein